ncbi:MAG: short-chain dehydrogenase [Ottowia sp.]|uniref:short-chain dehydrogenase n=1 Tax=Ottowia sp. TaxID=1898956 RepID=UPI0039E548D1
MRHHIDPIRTITVPPVRPRNPVVLAVMQRLGSLPGRRCAEETRTRERLARMDPDQRVREIGEW